MSNTPPASPPPDPFTIIHDALRGFLSTLQKDPRLAFLPLAVFFLHLRRALKSHADSAFASQYERVARSVPVALPLTDEPCQLCAVGLQATGEKCRAHLADPDEPETLTREEASTALSDAGFGAERIRGWLNACVTAPDLMANVPDGPTSRILRAYVRHLDKQAAALPIVAEAHEAQEEPARIHVGVDPAKGPDETVKVTYAARSHKGSGRVDMVVEKVERLPASATYHPTDEQHQHPLCHALGMQGVTEREAIEALYRANVAQTATIMRLAPWQPIAPILGATYTNPTADRLALAGRSKALAEMMTARLASLRAAIESDQPIETALCSVELAEMIEPFAATLAHVESLQQQLQVALANTADSLANEQARRDAGL